MEPNKDFALLFPKFRVILQDVLIEANKQLKHKSGTLKYPKVWSFGLEEGYRTVQQEQKIHEQGIDFSSYYNIAYPIIQKGFTLHSLGIAAKINWTDSAGNKFYKTPNGVWELLGKIAEQKELVWGGNWTLSEPTHIQINVNQFTQWKNEILEFHHKIVV